MSTPDVKERDRRLIEKVERIWNLAEAKSSLAEEQRRFVQLARIGMEAECPGRWVYIGKGKWERQGAPAPQSIWRRLKAKFTRKRP